MCHPSRFGTSTCLKWRYLVQSPSMGDCTVVYCTAELCWAADAQGLGDGTIVLCTCSQPMAPYWQVLLGGVGWTVPVDCFSRTANLPYY